MSVLPEREPNLAVQAETSSIGRVLDRPVRAPTWLTTGLRGRTRPEIRRETEWINKVSASTGEGLGLAPDVLDEETGEVIGRRPTTGGRVARFWADLTCWRGHSIIGGAIVSAYAGPQAGAAVTQASLGIKGALCPRYGAEGDARKLANQLGIRQADAWRLLQAKEYIWDEGEGKYVRTTTWRLFKIAARPYVPFIALGAGLLAVLVASSGD